MVAGSTEVIYIVRLGKISTNYNKLKVEKSNQCVDKEDFLLFYFKQDFESCRDRQKFCEIGFVPMLQMERDPVGHNTKGLSEAKYE